MKIGELSLRAQHALENAGVKTVKDLDGLTFQDVCNLKGVGIRTAVEIGWAIGKLDANTK
jgi:hypothetical protein